MKRYGKTYYVLKYLLYRITAKTKHAVHSPFLFNFIIKVLENKNSYYAYNKIEQLKLLLQLDSTKIEILNFGTGKQKKQSISHIAYNSTQTAKYAKLMFRMTDYFQPQNIIELGTSLGITTLYLAKANSNIPVYTIEGCPNIASVAKENFKKLGTHNIKNIVGNFNIEFPKLLNEIKEIGMLYIDGNHAKRPTLDYFEKALACINENTIIIFDDIHWSKEMEETWQEIIKHKKITLSIDLFKIGIVFFDKKLSKQNFIINF